MSKRHVNATAGRLAITCTRSQTEGAAWKWGITHAGDARSPKSTAAPSPWDLMQVNPPPQRDQRASTATAPVHADDHRSGPQTPAGAGDRNRASPPEAGSPIRGTPYGASLSL